MSITIAITMLANGYSADDCPDAKTRHNRMAREALWSEPEAASWRRYQEQHQCPTCGFWVVWRRRTKGVAPLK